MNELKTSNSTRRPGLTELLILLVVVAAAALAMSPNVADPDLWGHVQYGRDVLESGEIAETTTYSFTADGYRWINHENLSEIVMAVIADLLGPIGLVVGKILLSLVVIGLVIWWNLKRQVGVIATSMIVLLLGTNLGYHWSIRPQLSSFFCFAVMIAALQFCFEGWRANWHIRFPQAWFKRSTSDSPNELGYESWKLRCLWGMPLLFLVWANSHGGFVAGLCVYCGYLGIRAFESLNRRGHNGWGIVRRMILMAAVAILATLINPYGFRLHSWLLESLGNPRPEISDWATSELTSLIGLKFWLLVVVAGAAIVFSKKSKDATQMAMLGLTLWQSVSHFRHVPFFALLVAFWLGPHLQSTLERFKVSLRNEKKESIAKQAVVHLILLIALGIVSYRLVQRGSELKVERDVFPVDAVAYMQQHELGGKIVVTYDWAQYVIAAFCVDHGQNQISKVAFDGRFRTCYPQEVVDMHFDFLYGDDPSIDRFRSPNSAAVDPAHVLNYGGPSVVLISRKGESTAYHMQQQLDRWILLYRDGIAEVWGKKDRFGDPLSPEYIPPTERINTDTTPQGFVRWPAH